MTLVGWAKRALAFGRHIPVRQLARRLSLKARVAIEKRTRPRLFAATPALRYHLPPPLFPARSGLFEHRHEHWLFHFLGTTETLHDPIDWHHVPQSASAQLWRMNLHYMEYLEAAGDGDFVDLVSQWISANPPYSATAASDAWNAYALSLRITIWCQQLALRRHDLDSAFLATMTTALAGQVRYLSRHLETDIGGNHLVKNINALIWAGRTFAGPEALRWHRRGLALLKREVPRQFLPDHMHFERSPAYHAQVLADLLEVRSLLDHDVPELETVLPGASQVLADLTHPDGLVTQFADAGQHMARAPAQILAVALAIIGPVDPKPVFSYPAAGYFGLRAGRTYFCCDAGPIAAAALPAHAHGDALSFEWSVDGRRIIVDQGVYEYVAGPKRQASRSAASHNTLLVEGCDQGDFFGAFRLGRRARVGRDQFDSSDDALCVEGWHDGYLADGGPVHRRRFDVDQQSVRVTDTLSRSTARTVRVSLLLAPDVALRTIEDGLVWMVCGKTTISLQSEYPFQPEDAVFWPDMGVSRPTTRLAMTWPKDVESSWFSLSVDADQSEAQ